MLFGIQILIILVCSSSLIYIFQDIFVHSKEVFFTPGPWIKQAIFSFFLYFFTAFGVSDFTVSTVVYTKTGWVDIKKLPGTLNAQGISSLLITSLAYINSVEIDILTLVPFLLLCAFGSWMGPRVSIKLKSWCLKYFMAGGLFVAGVFMLCSQLNILNIGGTLVGLHGIKLICLWVFGFLLGFIRTFGVATHPLTMSAVYFSGLNPISAYPLMMGSSALANPVAAIQFVRLGAYERRTVLLGCSAGAVGSFVAVHIVKSMNVQLIMWLILGIVLLSSIDLFNQATRLYSEEKNAQ